MKHTLPTGEVEVEVGVLGPGEIYVFDKSKVGTVTGVVGEEEMIDEAEKLIKEARDKKID